MQVFDLSQFDVDRAGKTAASYTGRLGTDRLEKRIALSGILTNELVEFECVYSKQIPGGVLYWLFEPVSSLRHISELTIFPS